MYAKALKAGLVSLPFGLSHSSQIDGACVEGTCDHGTGVFEYNNGDVYYGSFAGHFRMGNGIISFNTTGLSSNSSKKYDGNWESDVYDGKGKLELIDSTVLKGRFENNVLVSGKIIYPNQCE